MIIYDLCCDKDHRFEGWFRSADDFESQLARQLLTCPQCDSHQVRRIPSAVAIGHAVDSPHETPRPAPVATTMMPGGDEVMALYRQFVRAVMERSEDVGTAFAEEARRIHYNEAPERPIRGQASPDECAALRDEGIEILSLPVLKDPDLN